MRKLLLLLVGVIALVIVAAIVLPFLVPTETYKSEITARVEAATGRRLTIDGPLRFSLLPTLGLEASEIRFANVEGGTSPDMVRLQQLNVELRLLPLLRGAVEVARFVLVQPEIHLEIDAEGRPNWELGGPAAVSPASGPSGDGAAGPSGEGPANAPGLPLADLSLGDVRLEQGTVTFTDQRSGQEERLDAVDLRVALPDLKGPLELDGSLVYKDETVEVDLGIEQVQELLQGGGSPIGVQLAATPVELGFTGRVDGLDAPQAAGVLALEVSSIRDLAAWLASPLDIEGEGLRHLRVDGQLQGSAAGVTFADATIELDEITGTGDLAVDLSGEVPDITGRLQLGALDLAPYLPPEGDSAGPSTGDGQAGGQGRTGAGDGAPTTTGGAPVDRQGGETSGGDWSDEPIALPPLGGANVELALILQSLRYREIQLDRTDLVVRLADGRFVVDLNEFALYGGTGTGRLEIDAAAGAPKISEQFQLAGLQALPFLSDAIGFDRLEGTTSLAIGLTTQGDTERRLIQNLQGDGRVRFDDGAIVGINLAALVRNVGAAIRGGALDQAVKTDFAELSGTFTIAGGRLRNDDMQLLAPLLRLEGAGEIDLPARRIDYRIEPRAVATLEGQGGRRDLSGLTVPVIVEGPWDDLTYRPDLASVRELIEDPERLGDLVDQAREIDSNDLKDLAKELLGGGDQETPATEDNPAKRLLKGLFGGD